MGSEDAGCLVPRTHILAAPGPIAVSNLLTRLTAALAGRYTVERELGRGGMASVRDGRRN